MCLMSPSKPNSTFNSKNRPKKIRANFSLKRFFMKKGFKPTEHEEVPPKNLRAALQRRTKEFKNVLRNPIVIAAHLDKVDTNNVE